MIISSFPWAEVCLSLICLLGLTNQPQDGSQINAQSVDCHINSALKCRRMSPVCSLFQPVITGARSSVKTGLLVCSIQSGLCQTLWEAQWEGRCRRRRGERPRRPDPSWTGTVGWWRRTGPKTNPETLQEPTSANLPVQTGEEKETKDHVPGFKTTVSLHI